MEHYPDPLASLARFLAAFARCGCRRTAWCVFVRHTRARFPREVSGSIPPSAESSPILGRIMASGNSVRPATAVVGLVTFEFGQNGLEWLRVATGRPHVHSQGAQLQHLCPSSGEAAKAMVCHSGVAFTYVYPRPHAAQASIVSQLMQLMHAATATHICITSSVHVW